MQSKNKKVKKGVKVSVVSTKNKSNYWIWIVSALILIGLLFSVFKGMTGNYISGGNIVYSLQNGIDQISPVLAFFLGADSYSGYMLFERVLFFLLILSIVFVVLKDRVDLFKGQKNIVAIISIVISLLSVRYINFEWLNTVVLSYAVLGIALTSFLPFLIYFFFLQGMAPNSATARKIGWIFFACVYFGLYFTAGDNPSSYGSVYMWTGFAALAFLFFDGTINRYLIMEKIKGSGHANVEAAVISVRRKMFDLKEDLNKGIINKTYYDKQMTVLEENLKVLLKHSF